MKLPIAIPKLGFISLAIVLSADCCGGGNSERSNKGLGTGNKSPQPVKKKVPPADLAGNSNSNPPLDSEEKVKKQIENRQNLETQGNSALPLTSKSPELHKEDSIEYLREAIIDTCKGVQIKQGNIDKIQEKIVKYNEPKMKLIYRIKKTIMPRRLEQLQQELEQNKKELDNLLEKKRKLSKKFEQATGQSQVLNAMRQKKI